MKYRSSHLFLIMFVVAFGLAFLSKESLSVALATIFCCISAVGLIIAAWVSGRNFMDTVARSIRHREFGLLSARIKWLMIDGLIFAWLFVAISTANFVLENYVAGAKSLMLVVLIISPFVAAVLLIAFGGSRFKT